MEQLLRIVKQLMATGGMLGSIPKPVKMAVLYLSVIVGVMVIFKVNKGLDPGTKTFVIIAIIVLAIITGLYYAWQGWQKKQQNQQFGGEIAHHTSKTPIGIDAGQRARLDDMRKKFQAGVDAYKSRGKNLYSLPWYAMVGEPGSGKTEAIRHSNVGFPPGMQDEFQGVGGTINMNWWFTNKAVLLDTAGRLMFEEVKPGETSEWQQFLSLLKKNRPNEPINGLFLVIPSDSLIKDSADAIQKKAGKIAQQLDVIQRMLDVRFPVFVVVTKCDKINGFREFFDGLTDPQLQHQIMGWSNPEPLDEPFKPELVDKHLDQVADRLRRRRLGLMRDPISENPDNRRTDEVDALYAFPHSLGLLGSRLRRYLETIFVAGEWSAKPLFLRGIYFTSSMREGSALDAELAEAIGISVDELPEGKVWERERAYFLRDVFLEKAFREKGLVTRASNTKQMLRNQQLALFGVGFAALIAFAGIAWFARSHLPKDQNEYWQAVAASGWHNNKIWKSSIVPMRADGLFESSIPASTIKVGQKTLTLPEFHLKLRELTEQPLAGSIVFGGVTRSYNRDRLKAQRIVLEGGVIAPLLEAARQKMVRGEGDTTAARFQPDVLAHLIQIESDILSVSRGTSLTKGELSPEAARIFLRDFQNYVAGAETQLDTNLVAAVTRTYSSKTGPKSPWPPAWASGGANSLTANGAIDAGLKRFLQNASNIQTYETQWKVLDSLRNAARVFTNAEWTLFATTGKGEKDFLEAAKQVIAARKNLDEELQKAGALFPGKAVSLSNAYQKFTNDVTTSAAAALGRVQEVNKSALAINKDCVLFRDIQSSLDSVNASLTNNIRRLLLSGDPGEFQRLDDAGLAGSAFAARAEVYARADALRTKAVFARGKLIGSGGKPLSDALAECAPIKSAVFDYSGKLMEEFRKAADYYLALASKAQTNAFFDIYSSEANDLLAATRRFPLVRDLNGRIMSDADASAAGANLRNIFGDLGSTVFIAHAANVSNDDWSAFTNKIHQQKQVVDALLGEDNSPGKCTITLAGLTSDEKDRWRDSWFNLKMDGPNCESVDTREQQPQKLGDAPLYPEMVLNLIDNQKLPNPKTFPIRTGKWGPLWLMSKYNAERDKTDARKATWLVDVPVTGAPRGTGKISLQLKFERPLPDWPEK